MELDFNFDERFKAERKFLDDKIFKGLKDKNTGFDVASIRYFSAKDFELVMERCEKLGVGICGIEPWPNGEYGGVKVCGDYNAEPKDRDWFWNAYRDFLMDGVDDNFAASYEVPDSLLKGYL